MSNKNVNLFKRINSCIDGPVVPHDSKRVPFKKNAIKEGKSGEKVE